MSSDCTTGPLYRSDALERDAALPGDEVVLAEQLGLGEALAARHLNAQIEQLVGACGDRRSPLTMPPASKSMMSAMRSASVELVEIFTTGATGLPVGVPRPVVKSTRFAPAPACAVTHSTSLPGVQSRLSPGVVAY